MRLLGLDVGDKIVGVAISDPSGILATPLTSFSRAKKKAEKEIGILIKSQQIEGVVAGLPLSEDGDKNSQCEKTEAFCRRLTRRYQVKLYFVDEHLSTEEVKRRLAELGNARATLKEKGKIDALAASIILQTFLDSSK